MTIPDEMIEIAFDAPGPAESLHVRRAAVPAIGDDELLVRVAAAGVNRPDILQRQGHYPPPPGASPTLGLEVAGEVVAVGTTVTKFQVGDRVCGLTNGGGYAEYCRLPSGQALPWPAALDAVHAAAIPETFFTVWANLFQMGKVRAGETVLVHGGSSGIGTTALMLLHAFGIRTMATAGSDEKCDALRRLHADPAINYRTQDFADVVREATQGRGVDAILDIVGAAYLQRNLASLAKDGRLLIIALQGGAVADRFDLRTVMTKRLVITGSTMRPRTASEKAAIAAELHEHVWPLLGPDRLQPVIHAVFPLQKAVDAHRLMESGTHVGKIVLTL